MVLKYLEDLPKLFETASMEEKRILLNSFIEGTTKEAGGATIGYRLPVPQAPEGERSIKVLDFDRGGGAEGSRTPDLLNAIEALSQLSYGPTRDRVYGGVTPISGRCNDRITVVIHDWRSIDYARTNELSGVNIR